MSILIRAGCCLGLVFLGGCASLGGGAGDPPATAEFYTVTAEIALARGEPWLAASQYGAAVADGSDPELLQRATEVCLQGLQPSLAAKVAKRWIGVQPESVEAERAAARSALALYRIDDAASHYYAVLKSAPGNVDVAFADIENDLTGDDDIFGARAVADRLAAFYPDSAAAIRTQGLTALRADDPEAAARALTLALSFPDAKRIEPRVDSHGAEPQDDSTAATARRTLAQTLLRARVMAGDAEEPLAEARASIENDDSATNRFDYSVLLLAARRDDAAAQQLMLLADRTESKPAALRLLGVLEFERGHFEAADAAFRRVLRTNQFVDDAFYYLAVMADRNGDSEQALRLFSRVQHGDNVLPALLRAAAILYTHGAPAAADELFDKLREDEPQRAPEIINSRARIYADSGELSKAQDTLQKGLDEYPDNVELRYARASVYDEEGRVPAALRELDSVLKKRPGDPTAMNALGFTLADHRKSLTKARELIERAHAAAPKNAAILDSLGWVLFRQKHSGEALPYLREAYADDHGGDIAAHLGEVLWQQGKRDDARQVWTQASIVDVDNKLLKATRQRLQAGD